MSRKTILITGCSTGVGFESAILLANQGYQVFATMRNLDKAEPLKQAIAEHDLDITILPLDVTDSQSVDTAVAQVIEQAGKIDVLLNNAGAGFSKTLEQASMDEIEWVTNVNYFGVIRTTKAVIPHMREAKSGHIVNISSVGGLVGQPFNELYCGAKFAIEGFTEALACYTEDAFNLKYTVIEPGGIATEFVNNAIAKTVNASGEFATGDYAPIFQQYMAGVQARAGNAENANAYQTAGQVAEVIAEVIAMEQPPFRIRTSDWAEEFTQPKTQADPDGRKLVDEVKRRFL